MSKKSAKQVEKQPFRFRKCECGSNNGMYRFWNRKWECPVCAAKSFRIWYTKLLATIAASATAIILILKAI